ncbi:MAG: MarR family transcriptional regulator [Ilumatobacteraceae bacterium]
MHHARFAVEGIGSTCITHAIVRRVEATPGEQLAEVLGLLLHRGTRAHLYASLTEGIDPTVDEATYPVLSGIARFGPCNAASLAHDIGLDRSVVSRHASRLERGGLLLRTPDPDDRRSTLLSLSEPGREAVAAMRRRLATIFDDHLATWPPAEAREFTTRLHRFVAEGPLRR